MIDRIIYYTILYLSYDDGWIRSFLKKGSIGKDLYLIFLIYSYHNFLWNEFFAINGDWLPYYENKEKKVKNSRESVQNMFKYLSKCRDFDSFQVQIIRVIATSCQSTEQRFYFVLFRSSSFRLRHPVYTASTCSNRERRSSRRGSLNGVRVS